jgi:hypothetical protein
MTTRIINDPPAEDLPIQGLPAAPSPSTWTVKRPERPARRREKVVLWIAVALVVLMCAFPPVLVHRDLSFPGGFALRPEFAGWAFFLSDTVRHGARRPFTVDGGRLACQLGIVIALAVGTLLTYRWSDQERGDGAAAGDE